MAAARRSETTTTGTLRLECRHGIATARHAGSVLADTASARAGRRLRTSATGSVPVGVHGSGQGLARDGAGPGPKQSRHGGALRFRYRGMPGTAQQHAHGRGELVPKNGAHGGSPSGVKRNTHPWRGTGVPRLGGSWIRILEGIQARRWCYPPNGSQGR